VKILHAGTKFAGDCVVTNGGRVLGVTGAATSLKAALASAYEAVSRIHFEGMHYQKRHRGSHNPLKPREIRGHAARAKSFPRSEEAPADGELSEVRAVGDTLEGCAHARPGASARFCSWIARPWRLWTSGRESSRERYNRCMNVNGLQIGRQLLIGKARLEVSAVCTPVTDGSNSSRTSQRALGTAGHAVRAFWRAE